MSSVAGAPAAATRTAPAPDGVPRHPRAPEPGDAGAHPGPRGAAGPDGLAGAGEGTGPREAVRPATPPARRAQRPARLDLRYHTESDRWMVVVRDAVSGRVLATIPPEELLETIGRIRRVLGLLVDETA